MSPGKGFHIPSPTWPSDEAVTRSQPSREIVPGAWGARNGLAVVATAIEQRPGRAIGLASARANPRWRVLRREGRPKQHSRVRNRLTNRSEVPRFCAVSARFCRALSDSAGFRRFSRADRGGMIGILCCRGGRAHARAAWGIGPERTTPFYPWPKDRPGAHAMACFRRPTRATPVAAGHEKTCPTRRIPGFLGSQSAHTMALFRFAGPTGRPAGLKGRG